MSATTAKRKAEKFSHVRKMIRGKSTTRPGSIKALTPIRSGPWDEASAGTAQIDTVRNETDTSFESGLGMHGSKMNGLLKHSIISTMFLRRISTTSSLRNAPHPKNASGRDGKYGEKRNRKRPMNA